MKFVIDRSTLLRPLGHVQSVVERRHTIPVLANVLLRADEGKLALTATDMDMEIVDMSPCHIDRSGLLTVSAHMLHDIVRKLPDGAEVRCEADGEADRMVVRAGRSMFTLPTLAADEFPVLEAEEVEQSFTLSAAELRLLIDRTRFAISTEETRYYLNGMFLHAGRAGETPILRAVATDGHRLARAEMPLPKGAEEIPAVIVPRKAVAELRRLIDDFDGDVAVFPSQTRFRFAFAETVLTTKLIDGTFPDYERVIPTANDKILRLDRRAFSEAVDRVSTVSTERTSTVKMSLSEGMLVLSVNSPESGSATEELEVGYDFTPLDIGFNARYLLDIAAQIDGTGAMFELADSSSPTVVRDQEDGSALYVLMPMRV